MSDSSEHILAGWARSHCPWSANPLVLETERHLVILTGITRWYFTDPDALGGLPLIKSDGRRSHKCNY